MSIAGVDTLDATIHKTHISLNDLIQALNWGDRYKAYIALHAAVHALPDRLTMEEAVYLGAQLPLLIRGFDYEGWTPSGKPDTVRHNDEFLAPFREYFRNDLGTDPERIVRAVFDVLAKRVTEGKIADVKSILSEEIADLWPETVETSR